VIKFTNHSHFNQGICYKNENLIVPGFIIKVKTNWRQKSTTCLKNFFDILKRMIGAKKLIFTPYWKTLKLSLGSLFEHPATFKKSYSSTCLKKDKKSLATYFLNIQRQPKEAAKNINPTINIAIT